MSRIEFVVVALLVVVPLPVFGATAYIWGYFALGDEVSAYRFEDTWRVRTFETDALVRIYGPAAEFEAYPTGYDVSVTTEDRFRLVR